MRSILTIASKDFRGYFSGAGFYVIAGLFTAFLSYTYLMQLDHFASRSAMQMYQMGGQGAGLNLHNEVIIGHISSLNLVLLFLIPFLTVRLFAEEKKMRTFDLLLTSPVTATEIVLGKYLAALGVVSALIVLSLLYPIATLYFTPIQWGPLASAYVGLFFVAGIYVAVGLFASSLTESVILAGFLAIILSLLLWFIAWGGSMAEDQLWQSVLKHLSMPTHFQDFLRGTIQTSSLVFSFSVIGIYTFLTQRVIESARWR